MRALVSPLLLAAALVSVTCQGLAVDRPAPPEPQTLAGKVVGVSDGDTITVLDESRQQRKVRLLGIDAPEKRQAFGARAKQALSKLAMAKTVHVTWSERDRYGRILGDVRQDQAAVDEPTVNEQMVRDGWAWHFVRYSDDEGLTAAEVEARESGRGLWADKHPVAPWEWRKVEAEKAAAVKAQVAAANTLPVAGAKANEPPPEATPTDQPDPEPKFWLNTKSNVRHNSGCRNFGTTKRGRYCGAGEGKACGICGG